MSCQRDHLEFEGGGTSANSQFSSMPRWLSDHSIFLSEDSSCALALVWLPLKVAGLLRRQES